MFLTTSVPFTVCFTRTTPIGFSAQLLDRESQVPTKFKRWQQLQEFKMFKHITSTCS